MNEAKWLYIFVIFTLTVKGAEVSCSHGLHNHDLFTCESLGSGSNASITFDAEVSVGHGWKRSTQNHSSLCAEFSPKYNYLEIRFNHFYDVCAVTTWTKNSNHTLANVRIQYSNSMTFRPYYQQVRAIVKDFQQVNITSGIVVHRLHLTTKYIRFIQSNWKKGSCVNFDIYGNIALCKDSQKRMDTWCQITPGFATAMDLGCSGELKARFDRSKNSTKKMWRCYHESALTADLSRYNDKLKSPCYYTRHRQLNQVLQSCSQNFTVENCSLSSQDGNEAGVNDTFLREVLGNLSKINETTTVLLSPGGILDILNVLEKIVNEDFLGNTTQHVRDQFAKNFLHVTSALLNDSNISAWKSSQLNSSTLSRLLKTVEDFGVAFVKYLECDNQTANEKKFSFVNIKLTAKSCIRRTGFPLKLFPSDGCSTEQNVSEYCNTWSDVMENAILPKPMSREHQQYQVSFISYKTAHKLFPVDPTRGDADWRSTKVDSRVMSLTVRPEGVVDNGNPVVVTLRPLSHNSDNEKDYYCGFWNFSASGTVNGAWSTDGCTLLLINSSRVTCHCNHLTNFALLLRVDSDSVVPQGLHREVLLWMTYLGCSLSLAAEILCLVAFILLTNLKDNRVKIHFNLIACLAGAHLIFLTGIKSAVSCKIFCKTVAVSLHFLFLASFMWMLVEGIHLLSRIKASFRLRNEMTISYAIAYGLPSLIVGATFAVKFNEYGNAEHCWLSITSGTQWSFIGPVCGVLLVNFVVLGVVLERLTRTRMFQSKSELQKLRTTVRASMTLTPLLGLTWLFGIFAVDQDTIVFQYLFVAFNSLQGVFLFLFHCIFSTEVKAGVRSFRRRRRVTQEVKKVASKGQVEEQHKIYSKTAWPFIELNERIEVIQAASLTRIVRRLSEDLQDINVGNKDCKPSNESTSYAWAKKWLNSPQQNITITYGCKRKPKDCFRRRSLP